MNWDLPNRAAKRRAAREHRVDERIERMAADDKMPASLDDERRLGGDRMIRYPCPCCGAELQRARGGRIRSRCVCGYSWNGVDLEDEAEIDRDRDRNPFRG